MKTFEQWYKEAGEFLSQHEVSEINLMECSYIAGQESNRHHKVIYLYTVYDKRNKTTKILTYSEMQEFLTSIQDYQWFYLNPEPDLAFGDNWTIELRGDNSSMEDQYVCQEHESKLFEEVE